MIRLSWTFIVAGCAAFCFAAQASEYSEQELVDKLAPSNQVHKSRSLRNLVVEKSAAGETDSQASNSVSLVITFAFNSSRIESTSNPQLDKLAMAMNSERLRNLNFKIEGHTDAQGTAEYNLRLSQQRAKAVKAYLAGRGVASSRLIPEGMGFEHLANKNDPVAEENRRVVIKTIF